MPLQTLRQASLNMLRMFITAFTLGSLFVGVVIAGIYTSSARSCEARWFGNYETEYTWFAGCRLNVSGRWIPEDRFRVREIN